MNKTTFLTVFMLFVFSKSLFSQNFNLISASQNQVELRHTLDEFKEVTVAINGKSYQNFAKTTNVVLMEEGKPALPLYSQAVLLPNSGEANFTVEHDGFYEVENVLVAPSKGNLKRNVNPETIPHTFDVVYQEDAFFPGDLGTLSEPFVLRKTRGAVVTLFPYQYNPVTKTLRVYENMRVVVSTDTSKQGENELVINGVSAENDAFARFYSSMYINMPVSSRNYPILEESGEMLVIAADEYLDIIASLVEWKIKKGIKTAIVPVSEVGVTSEQIKGFIQNYYITNPEMVYILLVGDADKIPTHTYGFEWGEERWSDSYYGQLAGNELYDFFPEAFVGRFSGNANEIAVMVERTLEYEQNPMTGDWMTKGIGVASNEGEGYGNNGLSDFQHLRNIRYRFLDYDFDYIFEFYEGSQGEEDAPGNPTTTMLNSAINQGIGLFNYTGHGWTHGMSTGDYTNSAVNAATNNGMYPFVISVACNNGTFVGETCLAEAMLNATHNGSPSGAIAAAGSSILMSWAPPMQTQVEMTDIITRMYENNHKETLGGLFYNSQMSVLINYANSAVAREVMQTWVFFGDPSVTYRYRETQDIVATHPEVISQNDTSLVVSCDEDGVLFSLSQSGEVLGTAISVGGTAHIGFDETVSVEELSLVGTKQNFKPYMGVVTFGDLGLTENNKNNLWVYPNPATESIHIQWNETIDLSGVELRDLSGRRLIQENFISEKKYTLNVSALPSGVYLLTLSGNDFKETRKIIIK